MNLAARKWVALILPALLFILVPFFLIGGRFDAWAIAQLSRPAGAALPFSLVIGLLVADIAMPVPSSIVSTMAGALLGVPFGAFASWLGMTIGSVAGYYLGVHFGRPLLDRYADAATVQTIERDIARFGMWAIVAGRAVPVLAEATTLVAGVARVPFRRFITASALANLGVSLVYAIVGALSVTANSFLLALAGATLLPAMGCLLARRSGTA